MSETPDIGELAADRAVDEIEDIDAELPDSLPEEAPEADVIEQSRGVRPDVAGGPRIARPDSAIDEANEADRQEQAEVVGFDDDDETR